MRPANRAQRHPRVRRKGTGVPHARFLASQRGGTPRLRRRGSRAVAGAVAPSSEGGVWQTDESPDAGGRCASEFRARVYAEAGLGRDHPSDPGGARRSALGAGQAVDREPRPRIREKKGALRRLTSLAESRSEWVLGYEDETWWSRFEQPSL